MTIRSGDWSRINAVAVVKFDAVKAVLPDKLMMSRTLLVVSEDGLTTRTLLAAFVMGPLGKTLASGRAFRASLSFVSGLQLGAGSHIRLSGFYSVFARVKLS